DTGHGGGRTGRAGGARGVSRDTTGRDARHSPVRGARKVAGCGAERSPFGPAEEPAAAARLVTGDDGEALLHGLGRSGRKGHRQPE
ncbi:MAG: hypothetical protein K0R62_3489, partial [Nonomuraea muscovyensis]|nr:hypothetical protein [Nonomuraea muscovyensis]